MERIERLLTELKYEVTRGMMEGEIDETIGFDFFVPVSKRIHDGVVRCQFRTRPVHRVEYLSVVQDESGPRLKIVK